MRCCYVYLLLSISLLSISHKNIANLAVLSYFSFSVIQFVLHHIFWICMTRYTALCKWMVVRRLSSCTSEQSTFLHLRKQTGSHKWLDQISTPDTFEDSTVHKPKQISFRAISTELVSYLKKKRENPTHIQGTHVEFED